MVFRINRFNSDLKDDTYETVGLSKPNEAGHNGHLKEPFGTDAMI